MVATELVLQMQGISKHFSGVQALDNVDFEVRQGEIHALVGHNGAGKSTLLKILAGVLPADSGQVTLNGQPTTTWSPHQVLDHGVSFIYQELNLVQKMTVAQNISLGREPKRSLGMIDRKAMHAKSGAALQHIAADNIDVETPLEKLSVAKQQLVAIARALDQRPTLLVLDEPTSRLGLEDTEKLFDLLDQMRSKGLSIIYVSHRLDEIYRIADRVTVLRDGKKVITAPINEVTPDALVQYMIGDRVRESLRKKVTSNGKLVLQVRGLDGPGVEEASLDLHAGEVLGLVGAIGAGKTELAHLLFGIVKPTSGAIHVRGQSVKVNQAAKAIEHGIALCPEDRKSQGLLLDSSIRDNVTLAGLRGLSLAGLFPQRRRESKTVSDLVEKLRVGTTSIKRKARTLSGGNQQKVVLAKWLCTQSQVFIFDEPTVGVDVQGKTEIYELMYELAGQGAGVLFVTSDIEEGLSVCERLLVMYRGKIVSELHTDKTNLEEVLLYVMGGKSNGKN